MSSGGGSQPQVTQQAGDPQLAQLNQYSTDQIIKSAENFGGLQGLTAPQPYMFTDFGRNNLPGNMTPGPEQTALNSLQSFYSKPALDPYTAAGLGQMQSAIDPTGQQQAAQNLFNSIIAPSIRNNAVAAGMGRSGAVNEQLMNAGVQMALPIQQQITANQMALGKQLPMLGQLLNQREGQGLQQLYQLATMPRQEQASAEQAQRNAILTSLGRFPVSSGAGQSTTSGIPGAPDQTGQMVMGAISSLMSMAMMAAMMACHVARALWLDTDPARFVCAAYEVNFQPHGWLGRQLVKAYRRLGPRLARSRLALTVLRPVFERIAQRGARKLGVTI